MVHECRNMSHDLWTVGVDTADVLNFPLRHNIIMIARAAITEKEEEPENDQVFRLQSI